MCRSRTSRSDVAFNWFSQVQKKTIRKAGCIITRESLSISRSKTRGFTAQGSVNKRLNQIELQKMKGKHEWGNEGADVVSDQITISTDYWRGKRLIELFYHTESLRLSPHRKPIPLPRWLVGEATCVEKLSRFGVTVFAADGNAVLFICHIQSIKAADWRRRCVFASFFFSFFVIVVVVFFFPPPPPSASPRNRTDLR